MGHSLLTACRPCESAGAVALKMCLALRLVMSHLVFLKTLFRGAALEVQCTEWLTHGSGDTALAPLATHVNWGTTQGLSFLVFKMGAMGARIAHFPYAEG